MPKCTSKRQESILPHVRKKVGSYSRMFTCTTSKPSANATDGTKLLVEPDCKTVPKLVFMAPTCVPGFENARFRFNTTGFEFEICSYFTSRPFQVSGK